VAIEDRQGTPWVPSENVGELALLVESVGDYAIFLLDPQGNIKTWNRGAERIKGYSAGDAIGQHFSLVYTPEDKERNHPAHELRVAARDGRFEEEGWRVRKDGSRFWANVVITALRDPDGRLRAVLGAPAVLPLSFVVSTDGRVNQVNPPEVLRSPEQVRAVVQRYLGPGAVG